MGCRSGTERSVGPLQYELLLETADYAWSPACPQLGQHNSQVTSCIFQHNGSIQAYSSCSPILQKL